MTKSNFLYDIFQDYQKNKDNRDKYCLWRWCTTCGNRKIRDELFLNSINELDIDFEETKMKEGFLSLSNIREKELHKKIVDLICEKLNSLSDQEIDHMIGPRPFYTLNRNVDDFIKFIIMEIYYSLKKRTTNRKKVMNYLTSRITNDKVNYIITKMNIRYEKNKNPKFDDQSTSVTVE